MASWHRFFLDFYGRQVGSENPIRSDQIRSDQVRARPNKGRQDKDKSIRPNQSGQDKQPRQGTISPPSRRGRAGFTPHIRMCLPRETHPGQCKRFGPKKIHSKSKKIGLNPSGSLLSIDLMCVSGRSKINTSRPKNETKIDQTSNKNQSKSTNNIP